jgi:PAS domain S-box-containing protein
MIVPEPTHNVKDTKDIVLEHITATAYWDKDHICRFANNTYLQWFGRSKEELIDKITLKELLGSAYEIVQPHVKEALAGKTQVFERKIQLPNGGWKDVLATYHPHINDGEVKGFIINAADISYLKEPEGKLIKTKQQMLRNVIEAQEKERLSVAHLLRNTANQTLAYCNMILQARIRKGEYKDVNEEIHLFIKKAIAELNELGNQLSPSAIEHFGFAAGVRDYLLHFCLQHEVEVNFECREESIEALKLEDKFSIFRIIQCYLQIVVAETYQATVWICAEWHSGQLRLDFHGNQLCIFDNEKSRYVEIVHRVEYYGGDIELQYGDNEHSLKIKMEIC